MGNTTPRRLGCGRPGRLAEQHTRAFNTVTTTAIKMTKLHVEHVKTLEFVYSFIYIYLQLWHDLPFTNSCDSSSLVNLISACPVCFVMDSMQQFLFNDPSFMIW